MRISLQQAALGLQQGQVVAVPTETVYGLAASLNHLSAIERIFELKGRPRVNPLIIHIAETQELDHYVTDYPPGFEALAKIFWPGPLTCILPVHAHVPLLVRAGLPTAGFRIPGLQLTRALLKRTGPLVMPSANLSGRPSATHPEHVEDDFGLSFPVLDGGVCQKGVESTILLYQDHEWVIARLGALAPEVLQSVLGYQPKQKIAGSQPICPGQLFRHYAPRARLLLGGDLPPLTTKTYILGFQERSYPAGQPILLLGSLKRPEEVAENLYQRLRQLDQEGAEQAWVDLDFPRHGLWQTIAERLMRAGEML